MVTDSERDCQSCGGPMLIRWDRKFDNAYVEFEEHEPGCRLTERQKDALLDAAYAYFTDPENVPEPYVSED